MADADISDSPLFQPGDEISRTHAFDASSGLKEQYYRVDEVILPGHPTEMYLCSLFPGELPVTLKTVRSRLPWVTASFRHEAAVSLTVGNHPNVVYCLTVERAKGFPFLVLERPPRETTRGLDLAEWLINGPLQLQQALEFTLDICRGLHYAGRRLLGLVHRDIKPKNILITPNSESNPVALAKICDFGVAIHDNTHEYKLSETGRIRIGSVFYMAPEQWRNDKLDVRADIYSIGGILYHMIVGSTPYQVNYKPQTYEAGQQWEADWRKHHEETPPPVPPSSVPVDVGKIILKCLEKDPSNRPQSLEQLISMIEGTFLALFGKLPHPDPLPFDHTPGTLMYKAVGFSRIGRPDLAIAYYDEALTLKPDDAILLFNRGMCEGARGHDSTAIENYDAAITCSQGKPEFESLQVALFTNRANSHAAEGHLDLAMTDYEKAINLEPDAALPYFNRAWGHNILGNKQEALADYQRCIDLDPQFYLAYSDRGLLLHELGRYDEAKKYLEEVVRIKPDFATGHYNLANTCVQTEDLEEALHHYTKALDHNPLHLRAANNRGNLNYKLGEADEAWNDLTYAITKDPTFAQAYLSRCLLCYRTGRNTDAYEDLKQVISLDTVHADAYFKRLTEIGSAQALADIARIKEDLNRGQDANGSK